MLRWLFFLLFCGFHPLHGFTLMNWNIHRGVGLDEAMNLERIAAVIREQHPDVVLLQEVDQGTQRSKGVKQANELAKLLGWQVYFGKAIDFQGGEYGQAILSPHPLKNPRVYRLSEQGEARVAVAAEISYQGREISVVGVHLDSGAGERRLREVTEWLRQSKELAEAYVAGDWNEAPTDPAALFLEKNGWTYQKKVPAAVLSFPADQPTVEIDYVFTKGVKSMGTSRVIDVKNSSDHRAVVTTWK